MLCFDKLIMSITRPGFLGQNCSPPIWAQIEAIWAQIRDFGERTAKPLLRRGRGRKPSDHENRLETSAVQRKRCEKSPNLCPVLAKVALFRRGHSKDTISIPRGVSERQKGPSEPSDYLGLRVSHSLSRQRSRVRAPSSPPLNLRVSKVCGSRPK